MRPSCASRRTTVCGVPITTAPLTSTGPSPAQASDGVTVLPVTFVTAAASCCTNSRDGARISVRRPAKWARRAASAALRDFPLPVGKTSNAALPALSASTAALTACRWYGRHSTAGAELDLMGRTAGGGLTSGPDRLMSICIVRYLLVSAIGGRGGAKGTRTPKGLLV